MPEPYDWHYDRNQDGELDFFEKYEMYDDMDRFAKRGYYAEDSLGIDDPDDYDDDDDDDFEDDDDRNFEAGDDDGFGADDAFDDDDF